MLSIEELGYTLIGELFKKAVEKTVNNPSWIREKLQTKDPFRLEAKKYVNQIIERYNSMRIIGMDHPVPLDDIYINVNVKDRSEFAINSKLLELEDSRNLAACVNRSVPATEAVNNFSKILVLGRPGAGKTTFLKYLVITSLKKTLKYNLVPIFISLKEYSQESLTKLETVLIHQFEVCELFKPKEFVRTLLRNGRCLILLDGFDEVDKKYRSMVITQIEKLTKDFPKNRFVLSCRTAANTYVFPGFREIEIANFNENQIHVFIRKWFRSNSDSCIKELKEVNNKGIRDLASNPLMLTLICIAYGESFSFPESRVILYEVALEALIKKWDTSRDVIRYNPYKNLTVHKKELLFSRIAAIGFERHIDIYSLKDVAPIIDDFMIEIVNDEKYERGAKDVLDAIEGQHGIIVRTGESDYTFSHLTFQEYYTAKYITDNTNADLIEEVVFKHIGDPRWNEVFLIYCGLQKDASLFVYKFKVELDKLRKKEVMIILLTAKSLIKKNDLFSETVSLALSLYQLLNFDEGEYDNDEYEDDEYEVTDSFDKSTARGEHISTAFLAELIAEKLAREYKLDNTIDNSAIMLTDIGLEENLEVLREESDSLSSYDYGYSMHSLQQYLFGIYVLTNCLIGEAVIRKDYRKAILGQLFSDGCPEPPKTENEFLFN